MVGGRCHSRLVTDMFTWLQCFSMYVNIRASHSPAMLPELMAYMSHIIKIMQDWPGFIMILHFAAKQLSRPLRNGRLLTPHFTPYASRGLLGPPPDARYHIEGNIGGLQLWRIHYKSMLTK